MKAESIVRSMKGCIPKAVKEHSPAILVGTGIACFIGAGIMAVHATPKAVLMMDNRAAEMFEEYTDICEHNNEEPMRWNEWLAVDEGKTIEEIPAYYPSIYLKRLGAKEAVKSTWKCYIPSVTLAGLGIGCVVGGFKLSGAKTVAMAGIASAAERKLIKYQDAIDKVLDEDRANSIKDEVAKREIEEVLPKQAKATDVHICANNGPDLVFESLTGRFFRSDRELIRAAINDFNKDLIDVTWKDANEWFMCLDIPDVKTGNLIGWNNDHLLDICISSCVAPWGEPALALVYNTMPTTDFIK